MISESSLRGGIDVITELGQESTSQLIIRNAGEGDSGQYTCNPANTDSVSVRVHILNGKYTGCYLISKCTIRLLWS